MMIASPVFRELDTPLDVLATFQQLIQQPIPLLLHSGTDGDTQRRIPSQTEAYTKTSAPSARFSFAAANPTKLLKAWGNRIVLHDLAAGTVVQNEGRALDIARQHAGPTKREVQGLPPFQTGWAGVVGYEYGTVLERIARPSASPELPDVQLAWYPWVIAWDHEPNRCWIIAEDVDQLAQATALIQRPERTTNHHIKGCLAGRSQHDPSSARAAVPAPPREWVVGTAPRDNRTLQDTELSPSVSHDHYLASVERIREYIAAGDVFQVNLSQQFVAPLHASAWKLYRQLNAINPAPFSAYFDTGDYALVSASPERFLHLSADGHAETRPIKGTRPRGKTPADDRALSDDLLNSEKDRAEHVMIVDVLRNDLARVSEFGSVRVPDLLRLESYATVHHLVSTVESQLSKDKTAFDLLHAAFPGGSITGAPKVRAMEIIAELETVDRGAYCGAIGYVSATGAMDTNVAIRTCTVTKQGTPDQSVVFSAGGGIVYDSSPEEEYQETLDKAAAIMQAIQEVNGSSSYRILSRDT